MTPRSSSSLFTCLPILPPLSFHTEVVSCVQGCQFHFYLLALYVLWKGTLKNFYLCIYFWLCWVFSPGCGLSLVAATGGYPLVAVRGLLIAVASHCTGFRCLGFHSCVHGLSCPMGMWDLPGSGIKPVSLHW